MSAFDDLTLGEVDDIERVCLNGKTFTETDPLKLAGAVMWATKRRDDKTLDWDDFKYATSMGAIRVFAETEMAEQVDNPLEPS